MKKILFTFGLIFVLTSCSAISKKQRKLEINVSLSNKISYQNTFIKKCTLYPIRISLINNSDSTLNLWIMSCSWERCFIFNSNSVSFFNLGCDKDVVDIVKLNSGETKIYKGYIKDLSESDLKNKLDLKLGFVLIRENVSFSESKFYKILEEKKHKKEDIIWCSKPINFN